MSESAVISFRIDSAVPPVIISDLHWYYTSDFIAGDPDFNCSHVLEITNLTSRTNKSFLTFSGDLLTLNISNLVHNITEEGSETDSGRYFLRAINSEGENSSFTDLFFLTPPLIVRRPKDQFVIVNNSAVTFECNAVANPQHVISWSFRNFSGFIFEDIITDIWNTTSTKYTVNSNSAGYGYLTIHNVTFADNGMYICMASNSYGIDSAQANLFVHGKCMKCFS